MTEHAPDGSFPRAFLYGAGILMLSTIVLAGWSRHSRASLPPPKAAAAVMAVDLHFEDRRDGGVDISGGDGQRIAEFAPNTNGFARSVLRSMTRQRRLGGIGPETPFRLTRLANGRLTLSDPATGVQINLEAFGSDNAGAFAGLLVAGSRSPQPIG